MSYARTGLAKSARGGVNMTPAMSMAAHAIEHAVAKSRVEPEAVEDVYLGNGAHGAGNLAGYPGCSPPCRDHGGATIQRHCSSGLNVALAANYIKEDGADVVAAGGVESISMPNPGFGGPANMDPKLEEMYPAIYMAMIETADCGDEHRRWPTGTVPTEWLLEVGLPRGPRSLRVPIQDSIQVFGGTWQYPMARGG